jgi:hypothetical protein
MGPAASRNRPGDLAGAVETRFGRFLAGSRITRAPCVPFG